MSMNKIMGSCHSMKAWLGLTLVLAAMMAVVSGTPIPGIQMVEPTDYWAPVGAYSASGTVTTVAETTTGSTSIQCTGRCTYKAIYNGTILWVYGRGFTPYEVIEFRLNEVYLGRSDTADANGDVATWFKRSIHSGTYELYAHEAHTGKNSTRLKFVVSLSEPQTTISGLSSSEQFDHSNYSERHCRATQVGNYRKFFGNCRDCSHRRNNRDGYSDAQENNLIFQTLTALSVPSVASSESFRIVRHPRPPVHRARKVSGL